MVQWSVSEGGEHRVVQWSVSEGGEVRVVQWSVSEGGEHRLQGAKLRHSSLRHNRHHIPSWSLAR